MGGGKLNDAPGPGQYYQEAAWKGKQRSSNSQWSKGQGHAVVPIQTNPPSIPSHNNVFGYEEDNRGNLIRQKNTE